VPAVRGIDLSVGSGQFFGLLGPNGAGKSTTIGMLTTLVLPTGGRAWVAALDVVADPVGVKRRIGVVTQNNTLDMQLTVAENLEFRSRFFGLGLREASRRAAQLLEVFGLADRRKAMSTDLSGGQAKRLLIARALVHRPDVLFLDEPTAGVDVGLRREMWALVRRLRAQGVTVILTTHYIEEAEEMADRVGVIDKGRIVLVEEKAALMRKLGKRRLTLALQQPLQALPTELAGWPLELEDGGRRLSYRFDAAAEDTGVPTLLRRLGEIGVDFSDLDTTTSTLEDIFVDLVGRAA